MGQDGEYYVVTDRWQRFSDLALSQRSIDELAESADEFLVHGVDVEGMRWGEGGSMQWDSTEVLS